VILGDLFGGIEVAQDPGQAEEGGDRENGDGDEGETFHGGLLKREVQAGCPVHHTAESGEPAESK